MKLQLPASVVSELAMKCEPATGSVSEVAVGVLTLFREMGHSPFTRKDVTSVLNKLLPETPIQGETWTELGEVLRASTVLTGTKGYYAFPEGSKTPLKVPEKAPKREVRSKTETDGTSMQWFEVQIRDKALDRRVATVLLRKFAQETYEDLLSETRMWFLKWAREGTCDSFIKEGKVPNVSILVAWVSGKISHRLYHEGQDAHLRQVKGVRTQNEITTRTKKGVSDYIVEQAMFVDGNGPTAVWVHENEDGKMRREFVAPATTAPQNLSDLLEDKEVSLIEDIIRIRRQRSADRYVRIFHHLVKGTRQDEVASTEGCTEANVNTMVQRVRSDLKEAPTLIGNAMKVLKLIQDEPFSTLEDIKGELKGLVIDDAIELLSIRGHIREKKGSFLTTPQGLNALGQDSLV